jgi:31-O-methyltransferase
VPATGRYTLPKATVYGYGQQDTKIVYHEMFEMPSRLNNEIKLRPGDVVVDGGANIGLFSLSLLQSPSIPHDVIVHALEPVPQTFAAAKLNLEGLEKSGRVVLHNLVRLAAYPATRVA